MGSVSLLPGALGDYQESLAWYSKRSARATAGFETAIDVALQEIAKTPERWPLCDDRHRVYILRRYPFSIVYRVEAGDVLVVAIAHSSRDSAYWQGRV